MNLIDIIIIYLTFGAPFGVYFFYQQRDFSNSPKVWINSLLVTLFWFPFAFKLLHLVVTKRFRNSQFAEKTLSDSLLRSKIENFEKIFSQILLEKNVDISLFDFRETFERYVGLSIFTKEEDESVELNEAEFDLFQITNHENKKLATKLLNRRNRSRLMAHQILARKDFLRMIEKIDSSLFEKEKVRTLAIDFVKLVKDVEAHSELHKIFQNPTQSDHGFPVKVMENEVWNPIETKQLPTPRKALNFRTLSATATTSKRD